ncbi:hypothetical protein [Niveibacterium microcysteis]|uniref:Uncharacterized protein n=1 Tax=Niveibacterium microcysteis TaxID=2811415 RepID=A0ABX7M8P0_9RHOO|nr:hypothetical protein [Niveibacterium microcysteis]QSI78110.1 hypothetical protein JY500_05560 [Niveibacterium microcysteis]
MKRWFIVSGGLFIVVGVFYDAMPLELFGALFSRFSDRSGHVYYRVVPVDSPDMLKLGLLCGGTALLVAGFLTRSNREK